MSHRFLRPGWLVGHLLVLVAALVCLRLGWWQWERTHDADGGAQNLGYSLLWPVFAVAFVYMWIKYLKLERIKDTEAMESAGAHESIDPDLEPLDLPVAPRSEPASDDGTTYVVGHVDDSDDPELAAYNRALAEIAERDQRGH